MSGKHNAIALADALEAAFGWNEEAEIDWTGDAAWREDPLPLAQFMKEHMAIAMWDVQRQDFEMFLGSTVEDTKRLFTQNPPTPYNCAALVWGKGSGKDLISSAALAWFVHILLCLKNPQKFLGLEPTEAIDIALASPTLRQTRRITFTKFKNRLRRWQWLKDLLPSYGIKNPDRYLQLATEAADYVELPCNIRIHNLPLNSNSAEGFNIIAFIISEYAALQTEATSESATAAFETFVSSGRTRFQKAWKAFLTSFPRSFNDPQEQLIRAQEKGLFPELCVTRRPSWEVHPLRTFEDFAGDFERNPEDAWAKYGARPRAAIDSYFRSPHLLLLHASGAPIELLRQHQGLLHEQFADLDEAQTDRALNAIASLGQNPITDIDRFGDPILDRRGFPKLARWFRGQTDPTGEPYAYYAHLDPGLGGGDAFGVAIGHLHCLPDGKYQPTIDLAFRWTGRMFREFGEIYRPAWFSDTIEQYQTIAAGEVDFRTVREFLFFLKLARGFNFELVTYDGWNSAESIQALRQRDIPVGTRIVSKADYDIYKELVYGRQLRYYGYSVLIEESLKLQLISGTKVEAPRTIEGDSNKADSHKDVSDAVAAVCRHLVLLKDESVEFAKFPPPESWWDKPAPHDSSSESGKSVAPHPDKLSEAERSMWREFFEKD